MISFKSPQAITICSSWIAKGLSSFYKILTIPLLIHYLGVQDYSIFILLVSLEGWFLLGDFCISIGLQNSISKYLIQKKNLKHLITSTAQVSIALALFSLTFLTLFSPKIEYFLLHKIAPHRSFNGQLLLVTGIPLIGITLGNIANRKLYALSKGFLVHVIQGIGFILSTSLIFIFINTYSGPNKLYWSIFIYFFIPSLISCITWSKFFLKFDHFKNVNLTEIQNLLKISIPFWFYYLLLAITCNIDIVIISQFAAANEIVIYSLLTKIFIQSVFLLQSINNSIWPKFSEYFFSGNLNMIQRQIAKLNYLTVASVGFLGILLFFCLEWISSLFLNNQVSYSSSINLTITLIAIQYIFRGLSDNFSLVLQSTNRVSGLVYITLGQALISGLLQLVLVKPLGIHGIIIGITISYVIGLPFLIQQSKNHLQASTNSN